MNLGGTHRSAKEEEQKWNQEDGGRGSSPEGRSWKQYAVLVLKKNKSWQ